MVAHPEYPAVAEYPTPKHAGSYSDILEEAKAKFLDVVEKGSEFWEGEPRRRGLPGSGELSSVFVLQSKVTAMASRSRGTSTPKVSQAGRRRPAVADEEWGPDTWAVPAVRGVCTVEEVTTDQVMACIQLPGMRKKWDREPATCVPRRRHADCRIRKTARFEDGHMLARYDRISYLFYSSMFGYGWLVYGRDITGVQCNYRSTELNQEIIVIQVSVPDDGSYADFPGDESGKVRAKVHWSGWKLTPKGNDVEVKYAVNISLEGSIPTAMVRVVLQRPVLGR